MFICISGYSKIVASVFQSFDSADGTPPHHAPRLPSEPTTGLHRHNVSLEETYTSTSVSHSTPFMPHATSTVNKGARSHPKTGAEIHSMGMSLEDKIIKLLNSSSEVCNVISS